MSVTEQIKAEASRLGFQAVGIATLPAEAPSLPARLRARLDDWLGRGYHGQMAWLARDPARRSDPRRILPGCRSIICVGLSYYTGHQADESLGHGRIARYAWGRDYHHVFEERLSALEQRILALAPEARTRWYADTGPVMEKAWAQEAGLGWIGKHSNLVSGQHGSWLLLGEILTTLALEPDQPGSDLCGSCSLCIRACPTGAISEPYVVDARRCISYLTIELHRPDDTIPEDLAPLVGTRIFGCDDCLDVCPYNHQAEPTHDTVFQPSPHTIAPVLRQLAAWTEPQFRQTFQDSAIRRAKHQGFLRNVRLALKNLQALVSR